MLCFGRIFFEDLVIIFDWILKVCVWFDNMIVKYWYRIDEKRVYNLSEDWFFFFFNIVVFVWLRFYLCFEIKFLLFDFLVINKYIFVY